MQEGEGKGHVVRTEKIIQGTRDRRGRSRSCSPYSRRRMEMDDHWDPHRRIVATEDESRAHLKMKIRLVLIDVGVTMKGEVY